MTVPFLSSELESNFDQRFRVSIDVGGPRTTTIHCTFKKKGEIKNRKISKGLAGAVLALALIGGGVVVAQKPVDNVSGKKHPNLAAQRLSQQAYEKIVAAQQANEWDLDGHAAKAKDLLDQVNQQLKLAAEASNKNHK